MSLSSTEPIKKFVRAGAGAGKTWNLVREVVSQALSHHQSLGQWPRVVLTTYTRKATQELKERLLLYCLEEKPEALEFVQSTSFLKITTMHGLFSLFLSRHGSVLGLANQFKIIDSGQADHWRKQIIKNLIADNFQHSKLQKFEIRRLLRHFKSYESVYWSQEASALKTTDFSDFTNQYLNSLAQSLELIQQRAQNEVDGEKWQLYWTQLEHIVSLLKSHEDWPLLQEKLAESVSDLKKPRKSKNNPGLSKDLDELLKAQLSDLKILISDKQFSQTSWPVFAAVFSDFEQQAGLFMKKLMEKKLEETCLEPNDLENYALKIVLEFPQVVKKFSEGFDCWFIDEFQDTSPLQLKILQPMIGDRSCYIVGDPQQSIYLFRGSRSEVFLEKQKQMTDESAQILLLSKNYRSQSQLLNFINDFFTSLGDDFSPMEIVHQSPDKQPAVHVNRFYENYEEQEIHFIIEQISRLLKNGASPKDFCILTRTHQDSEKVLKELIKLGYPALSHSSSQFYRRREVLDVFAILQFVLNPWDNKNLILLMRSPWVALEDQKIVEVIGDEKTTYWPLFKKFFISHGDFYPGQCLIESLRLKKQYGVGWVFRKLLLQLGVIDWSVKIDSTGRREANIWKIINRVEKVSREPGGQLLQLAKEGMQLSIEEFADASDASSPVEPDKINLMTIHGSKGLQFKYVFMPFLHKKPRHTTFSDFCLDQKRKRWSFRVPLEDPNEFVGGILEKLFIKDMKKREQEESLRLLYVAATRAQHKLFISWTGDPHVSSWGYLINDYCEKNKDKGFVNYQKIETVNSQAYQARSSVKKVPEPLEDRRFISRPVFENNQQTATYQNFDQVKNQQDARLQGIVLHQLFETLKNHDLKKVQALAEKNLSQQSEAIQACFNYIKNLNEVPLLKIIENGYVEWGYQKQAEQNLVERRIDLWGIVDDKLWIVDYKTGSSFFKDKAFTQLQEYKTTLCEYLSWTKPVHLAAIYPFSQESFIKPYDQ